MERKPHLGDENQSLLIFSKYELHKVATSSAGAPARMFPSWT